MEDESTNMKSSPADLNPESLIESLIILTPISSSAS